MVIAQAMSETGLLTHDAVRQVLTKGLGGRFTGQKVLVLIPDHTRSLPLPELFRMVVEVLHDVRELNVMVALGTHPGYDEAGLNHLVGITAEERATAFKHIYAPHLDVVSPAHGKYIYEASKIPPEDCARLNLGYRDPATINPADWQNREDEGILYMAKAGEMLYKVKK